MIVPIALGIITDPPTLVLTYDDEDIEKIRKKKRRQRRMPIRNFNDRSDIKKTYFVLKCRHEPHLSSLANVAVFKMLRVIQEVMKGLETRK